MSDSNNAVYQTLIDQLMTTLDACNQSLQESHKMFIELLGKFITFVDSQHRGLEVIGRAIEREDVKQIVSQMEAVIHELALELQMARTEINSEL